MILCRSGFVAATLMTSGSILGGCVSAVDESNSFGFAANPGEPGQAPTEVADANTADPATPEDASSTSDDSSGSESAIATAANTAVGKEISLKKNEGPADEEGRSLKLLTSNRDDGDRLPSATDKRLASVAAYATPGGEKRDAERSLYASLFTQSEARTPLKNAEAGKSERVVVTSHGEAKGTGDENLPGVDRKSLFEIGQRASVDSELLDDLGDSYQMASLSGIARLAPSGLLVQRDDIVTNCFDPKLMGLLSRIEMRFKQRVVITSGFRSPSHNRRVNGAKASMHMACKAADLHVPGVNGQTVAAFVRSLPDAGGVGTYCHTSAIHVDVGARRDWNWACRQRKAAPVTVADKG